MGFDKFHIYVPTLNEEVLIGYTLEALCKVFPANMITVIDLGSTDLTLERIPSKIAVESVVLPVGFDNEAGYAYTKLKNEYSKRQKWVLWVDGDEIYPTPTLLRIKEWVEESLAGVHPKQHVLRLYWRVIKEIGVAPPPLPFNQGSDLCRIIPELVPPFRSMEHSVEYLYAGIKLFNSEVFEFRKAYPREVIGGIPGVIANPGTKKAFNGLWFWHGVLLTRSRIKSTGRTKRRFYKEADYVRRLTWAPMPDFPWDINYLPELNPEWVLLLPGRGDSAFMRYEGVLK